MAALVDWDGKQNVQFVSFIAILQRMLSKNIQVCLRVGKRICLRNSCLSTNRLFII